MREGFKETKIGWIPDEWDSSTLESICLPKEGMRRGPFGGAIKKEFFAESGFRVYEQRNAIYNDFKTSRYFINEGKYEELKAFKVQKGDFIISCSGTIGKIARVPDDFEEGVINQALLRIRLDESIANNSFFLQQFRFEPFQNKISDSTQGGAMKNLVGMSEFRKTNFVLPPLPEQEKIAEILCTVDEKLASIEAEIQKTQTLKKGLSQKLLTRGIGHAKFKQTKIGEIPECWKVVKFEDLLINERNALCYGVLQPTEGGSNGVSMLRTVDLKRNGSGLAGTKILKIPKEMSDQFSKTILKGDEILLSVMGTIGRTLMVQKEWKGWNVNRALAVIRVNDRIDKTFLSQLFKAPLYADKFEKDAIGSAQKRINLNDLRKYLFHLPPLEEQQKIASILGNVDDKLGILGDKKSAYTQLKKGLMQQLLTGRMRVKLD